MESSCSKPPMEPFHIEANGPDLLLRLSHEVSIEHARALHAALLTALPGSATLRVDARAVTQVHPSILQLLFAASEMLRLVVEGTSDAWLNTLRRLGLATSVLCPPEKS